MNKILLIFFLTLVQHKALTQDVLIKPINHNVAYYTQNWTGISSLPLILSLTNSNNNSKIENNVLQSANESNLFPVYEGKASTKNTNTASNSKKLEKDSNFLKRQGWSGLSAHQGFVINQSLNSLENLNNKFYKSDSFSGSEKSEPITSSTNEVSQNSLASHNLNTKSSDLASSASFNTFEMPSNSNFHPYNYAFNLDANSQNRLAYHLNQNRNLYFSNPQKFEDLNDPNYSLPQNSAESSENQSNQDDFRNSDGKVSSQNFGFQSNYERDQSKVAKTQKQKYQLQNPYLAPPAILDFNDWELQPEKNWFTSLIGGYKYRNSKSRSPLNIVASESVPLVVPSNFFSETSGLNLIRFPPAKSNWLGYNLKPQSSYHKPTYSYNNLYGITPKVFSLPNSFYNWRNLQGSGSSVPITYQNYAPNVLSSSSINYPLKIPYAPFSLQTTPVVKVPLPYLRTLLAANDLAFAESIRKVNTSDLKLENELDLFSFIRPHISFIHRHGHLQPFIILDDKFITEPSKEFSNESINLIPFDPSLLINLAKYFKDGLHNLRIILRDQSHYSRQDPTKV